MKKPASKLSHGLDDEKPVRDSSNSRARVIIKRGQNARRTPWPITSHAQTNTERSLSIAVEKRRIRIEEEAPLLLSCLAQGDSDAFWKIWEGYQDYLYRLCLRQMGGIREDAEDALSKAMIKAWYCLPNYAGKIIDLRAWLTRLILNLCIDIHRHHNRCARGVVSIEEIRLADEESIARVFESPEQALLRKEMRLYLLNAIDDLPHLLQRISILYFIQEMTYRDIAASLTISIENARKRIQQARAILREKLTLYRSESNSLAANWRRADAVEDSNLKEPLFAYYACHPEIAEKMV